MNVTWHLEKRYKSSWTIVIDLGRDPATGKQKRIYRSVKCNKKQAEQEALRLVAEILSKTYVKPQKLTLEGYLMQWLETVCVPNRAAKTVSSYRTCIEKHIAPRIGKLWLTDVEPMHIQQLYADMLADGVGKRTIELTHATLYSAFEQAIKLQVLKTNPAHGTEVPRPEKKETVVLSPDKIWVLLQAAETSPVRDLVHLALATGMRKTELLALKWDDINLDKGIIYVQRNLIRVKEKTILKEPKTKSSQRPILLDPITLSRLRNMRGNSKSEFVFTRADGENPMCPYTVTHQFARIAKAAGMPGLRFHDLRHAHATVLLGQGINPKIVQERLGHASIRTTMDIYSHVIPTMQKEAADSFANALTEVERRFSDGQAINVDDVN
jgi:integrase